MAAFSIDASVAAVACCGWRHCYDACWGMAAVESSQLPEACVVLSFCGSRIGAAMLCSNKRLVEVLRSRDDAPEVIRAAVPGKEGRLADLASCKALASSGFALPRLVNSPR